MTDRERRQQTRREEEDAVFNRMLLWVCGAAASELLVLAIQKMHVEMVFGPDLPLVLRNIFMVFSFLGVALAVGCGAWIVRRLQAQQRVLLQAILLVLDLFVWAVCVLAWRWYDIGLQFATLLPIVFAVLILIYFLYQRAFFCSSVLTAYGLALLWMYRNSMVGNTREMHWVMYVSIALMVVVCAGVYFLSKKNGKLFGLRILPQDTMYPMLYITAAVNAVAFAAVRLAGSGAAIYLIFALAAWFFAEVVYFTVKLM